MFNLFRQLEHSCSTIQEYDTFTTNQSIYIQVVPNNIIENITSAYESIIQAIDIFFSHFEEHRKSVRTYVTEIETKKQVLVQLLNSLPDLSSDEVQKIMSETHARNVQNCTEKINTFETANVTNSSIGEDNKKEILKVLNILRKTCEDAKTADSYNAITGNMKDTFKQITKKIDFFLALQKFQN